MGAAHDALLVVDVQNDFGAASAPGLVLPPTAVVVSKATTPERDVYSGFEGTDLDARLRALGVRRLYIGGLTTDYCVLSTVCDARRLGYEVVVLADAIRAVDAAAGDGVRATTEMRQLGAAFRCAAEARP